MSGRAIVFDSNSRDRELVADVLSSQGWWVDTSPVCDFRSPADDLEADVVFLDLALVDDCGLAELDNWMRRHAYPVTILLGAREHADLACEAMRRGAFHFLVRPLAADDVCHWAEKALQLAVPADEAIPVRLRGVDGERTCHIACRSPKMKVLRQTVLRAARASNGTVLVLGETGVGKEMVARAIHQHSPRQGPLVALSCPAIPEALFESELFGHERGSFTGAGGVKRGLVEVASGGTLFLDEIGDMPLLLQAKLLRVLQERVIRRVGGVRDIPVDIRVVAATARDLRRAVQEGTFREDLFYRLTVIPITIPPLRERREDIVPLARMFLAEYCREIRVLVPSLGTSVENALLKHPWPGNVRELQNWAQRMAMSRLAPQASSEWPDMSCEELPCCIQDSSPERLVESAPDHCSGGGASRRDASSAPAIPWDAGGMGSARSGAFRPETPATKDWITLSLNKCTLDEAERAVIGRALHETGGNKRKAAEMLGTNRATLYRKLAKFGWRSGAPAGAAGMIAL